ncbi:gluconate 2-dehydrogenase subunit 3 family protein [Cesiribacter sp. SM1]|uniref:gluconate 2-dehydrogenase subunit 3 family protein n=1 Tax=Cesiribacter sp. SM1 TaxID=2861196 RepID=UPI001CD20080|nr:gluconate 2-dehydrogenase subunit 3 family protein [Cesiribacter sp. SM1]
MNRRIALKNMALVAAGLLVLPGCDTSGWKETAVQATDPLLSAKQEGLLAEIVETLIPTTDTPGAKELKVHAYVHKMVADCFEVDAQEVLIKGLDTTEQLADKKYNKAFAAASMEEKTAILEQMSKSDEATQKDFYELVKGLTIRGYMTSEYVMTNITKYEMVPGRYHGCVPVQSSTPLS